MSKIDIKIIYEDNHLLIVEKPINIPVQKDNSENKDLLNLLKENIKQRYNKPGNVFLGLVHRLDRPVGGVMVFAKTSKAASRLSDMIRKRELGKTYLAVLRGTLNHPKGHLEHYLLKDSKSNTVRVVNQSTEGAKQAILDYDRISNKNQLSLVKVKLYTGRSHQIRVQFSAIGLPLFGDQKYGQEVNSPGQQIALWSTEITLKHPTTGEEMKFECKPPSNLHPWSEFNV